MKGKIPWGRGCHEHENVIPHPTPRRFHFHANQTHFHMKALQRTRFETEAQGNLEM